MAMVVTIMLLVGLYHDINCISILHRMLDASSKIYIEYLYTSVNPHISSLNCSPNCETQQHNIL